MKSTSGINIMITQREKEAMMRYLDFQVTHFVDSFARHVDVSVLQSMYDEAYVMLADLELTLDMDMGLKGKPAQKKSS